VIVKEPVSWSFFCSSTFLVIVVRMDSGKVSEASAYTPMKLAPMKSEIIDIERSRCFILSLIANLTNSEEKYYEVQIRFRVEEFLDSVLARAALSLES